MSAFDPKRTLARKPDCLARHDTRPDHVFPNLPAGPAVLSDGFRSPRRTQGPRGPPPRQATSAKLLVELLRSASSQESNPLSVGWQCPPSILSLFRSADRLTPQKIVAIQISCPLPHGANLPAVLNFIRHRVSDTRIDLSVQNRNMFRKPFGFGGPASLERPNCRYGRKLRVIPQLMKARYSCQTLAADAGCPKQAKRRPASSSLIRQAKAFDHIALRSLERFARPTLRNVEISCFWRGAPERPCGLAIGRKKRIYVICHFKAIAAIVRLCARRCPLIVLDVFA